MQWPPAYKKVILQPGDETAIHSGGRGGLSIIHAEPMPGEESSTPVEESILTQEEAAYLGPWLDWMERVDFENLWNKDSS